MAELSIRGYADHRRGLGLPGGSAWAVQKALKDGRITRTKSGKIDPKVADAEWAASTDQGKQDAATAGSVPTYAASRALREAVLARRARLDYEEKAGNLVRVVEVRSEYFRIARAARDKILAVPGRLAAEMVACTDVKIAESRMDEALREALDELVADVA